MREEIEGALAELEIEGKETRKRTARNISIIVALAIIFFLIPYFYEQFVFLWIVEVFLIIFGIGLYGLFSIGVLYQPLKPEFYAFKQIARAIQTLEKSKEDIVYEEAYRCLRSSHKTLKGIQLKKDFDWYEKINQIFEQFLKNLQLIVLPAIANSSIKKEHLEEIALALYSVSSSEIEVVNKTLESETSYKKVKPPPRKMEIFVRRFRESMIGKIIYSLALGYGLVLPACLIYVFATGQDFMIFARERPEIVVLGGLIVSGINLWKTR